MSISENIKRYRADQGLTQKELAEKCSLSESSIKYYETGTRNPKRETLKKIASALNVSVNLLEMESFDFEIFFEAMDLGWDYFPSENMPLSLANYIGADYDTLVNFYNKEIPHLPSEHVKGLLKFISEKSPDDFNRIYNDLIANDLYNLDNAIKDYGEQLYSKTSNIHTTNEATDSMDRFLLFIKHKGYPIANLNYETLECLYGKVNELLEFEFYKLGNKSNCTTEE